MRALLLGVLVGHGTAFPDFDNPQTGAPPLSLPSNFTSVTLVSNARLTGYNQVFVSPFVAAPFDPTDTYERIVLER